MTTTNIPPVAPPNTVTTKPAKTGINADFDTFLKMMTTQMTNQDPLNPVSSSDFAVQLATFSSVEQQIKTNDLLTAMGSQFGVLGMAQLAGWVGQEARSSAPVKLGKAPIELSYTPAATADQAVLVVRDRNDTVVSREDVSLDGDSYQWFGADSKGDRLPEGLYSLSLESYHEGEQIGEAAQVESYARILEARGGASGPTLVLHGGVAVAATAITALRVP